MPTEEELAAWEALSTEGRLWVLASEYNRLLAETGYMQPWPVMPRATQAFMPLDQWSRAKAVVRQDPGDIRRSVVRVYWADVWMQRAFL